VANFEDIEEARKLLGLGEEATLEEIKKAYRKLARRYHPDKLTKDDINESETMKKLNRAYELLLDYTSEYKYSFREEDVIRTYFYDEYMRTYKNRWFDHI
jgi:curved DNA-binding protein CbpA